MGNSEINSAAVGVAKLGDAIVARSLFPVEKRYGGDDEDEEDTKAKSVGFPVSKRYGGDDEDEENTKAKSVELPGN